MKLNLHNTSLKITAGAPKQFPSDLLPQVAIAGRSNVGKSSLINSLLKRKALARVSGTPGKTITINFYLVDAALYLVDLPGYGYAKRTLEDRKKWSALTDGYFTRNQGFDRVKLIIQLVDSRIGPTADDLDMLSFLQSSGVPHIIVATKADKLNATGRANILSTLAEEPLCAGAGTVILYSSVSHSARDELWSHILSYCGL